MISFDEYSNGFGEPATLAPGRPGYIPPDNYGEFTREHLDRPYFVKGEPRRRGGRPYSARVLTPSTRLIRRTRAE